jgi:hypothetical protein
MKKSELFSKIAAFAVAVGFGLLLTYNSLFSDEFPRGLYCPPAMGNGDSIYWDSLALLGPTRVWNMGRDWKGMGEEGLHAYFRQVEAQGFKSVLRNGDFHYTDVGFTDTIPYWVEYYSCGQYNIYEAEWDYNEAKRHDEGFYHFLHSMDPEDSIGQRDQILPEGYWVWYCDKEDDDTSGVMLFGPMETVMGSDVTGGYWAQTNWPERVGGRRFKTVVRVMANTGQLTSSSDPVFTLKILKNVSATDTTVIVDMTLTGDDLADLTWTNVEVDYLVEADQERTNYMMIWQGNCDFWVDWIKYMDMERGYWLWYTDLSGNYIYKDSIWEVIKSQCDTIEQVYGYAEDMVAWFQSDEPRRCSFRSCGLVNDLAKDSLQVPLWSPLKQNYQSRPELFTLLAHPPLINVDPYVFSGEGYLGDQSELDSLSVRLEEAFQGTQITSDSTLEFHFTGQAFASCEGGNWKYRNQSGSEILVESFMALAHGAKAIDFYRYTSTWPSANGDTAYGLVDYQDKSHLDPLFSEKWQAVRDVFTQLDSIGDVLLSLERDTAYCVYEEEPNPPFVSPITGIEFTEKDADYIEVGQFHDTTDTYDYLILVNRRTDADRHVNVYTNLTGANALVDLYTQEQFISSTGDFKGIPFDSGEGRVFRIEPVEDH